MKGKGKRVALFGIPTALALKEGTKQECQATWAGGWGWQRGELNVPHIQTGENAMGHRLRKNQRTRKGRKATVLLAVLLLGVGCDVGSSHTLGPASAQCQARSQPQVQVACFLLAAVPGSQAYQGRLPKPSLNTESPSGHPTPARVLAVFQLTFLILCLPAFWRTSRRQ